MNERRAQPRSKCRLHCLLHSGRDRIRARVLDLSPSGLCLLSPVVLARDELLDLRIDLPESRAVELEGTVWHTRDLSSRTTGRNAWSIGILISKQGPDYKELLSGSTVASEAPGEVVDSADDDDASLATLLIFHVCVAATDCDATLALTLGAESEEEARALVMVDLGEKWEIVELREACSELGLLAS